MTIQFVKYLLLAAAAMPHAFSSSPVLLPTPPMGYNNWAAFMCGLNESLFIDTANSMVQSGLLAAGYNRINLDDCWSTMERAPNGSMVWDTEKFPRGLPWLTGHLKRLGFIPGIYTDAGKLSCGGYPGAFGYEELDAKTFADWGFEYLKLDGCNMPTGTEQEYKAVYGHWHNVLSKMDKPMVFSESAPAYFAEAENLTDWYSVMGWVPKFGQLARHSRDSLVFNSTLYWPNITGWDSIMFNYGQHVRLARYQKPGYFNDPDFLNVDHFDTTLDEKKSHFAIWASMAAPLIISADVPNLNKQEIAYLTNKDFITVNQDPLALQSTLVSQDGIWDVLTKSLANGDRLVTIINRGNTTASHTIPFIRLGLPPLPVVRIKDLWTGRSNLALKGISAINIPSRGTGVYRISPVVNGQRWDVIPTGMIFNTFSLNVLNSSPHNIQWAMPDADDRQVWQARKDGTLRAMSNLSSCLSDLGDGKVAMKPCSGNRSQKWDYHITGNVVSRRSKLCLTEGDDGVVTAAKCLYEDNTQVFGLPSGVHILE